MIKLRRVYKDDAKMLDEVVKIDIDNWTSDETIDYITTLLAMEDTLRLIIYKENYN